MLVLPTMMVAQAVAQVFLSRAASLAREPERLRELTEQTALGLFAIGLPMFAAVALAGPQLFATVMGSEWARAGRYAQLLAPWFVVWLVSNPLSALLSVRQWQASALAFAAAEFVLRVGALLIGARRGSPELAVALLSASGVIISIAAIARFMRAGHSSIGRLAMPAARLLGLASVCLAPAAIALYAGSAWLAMTLGAIGIGGYYGVVLRSVATSGILPLGTHPRPSGASA
jgi:O-antigen/teichoic acid export membrane protein